MHSPACCKDNTKHRASRDHCGYRWRRQRQRAQWRKQHRRLGHNLQGDHGGRTGWWGNKGRGKEFVLGLTTSSQGRIIFAPLATFVAALRRWLRLPGTRAFRDISAFCHVQRPGVALSVPVDYNGFSWVVNTMHSVALWKTAEQAGLPRNTNQRYLFTYTKSHTFAATLSCRLHARID